MPDDEEPQSAIPLKPDGSIDFEEIERQYRLKFPPRDLSPEENAIIEELWKRKLFQTDFAAVARGENTKTHAYVTTAGPLTLIKWNGRHPVEKNSTEHEVPVGTTLKIVMMSRMEDFGLTDDLTAETGYHVRVPWDDARIINLRWEP